ncbi:MAG TPA: hypothetical protein VLD67_00515, partial [Vicinamibacterales bacterium]|nr:hypothetical protein [Vicinamibacterales bacterium]
MRLRFLLLPAVVLLLLPHDASTQGRGGRGGGAGGAAAGSVPGRRAITVDDQYRLRNVGNLQISPDGEWVLYSVSGLDSARDRSQSDLHVVRFDGSRRLQLTYSPEGEGSPRFSPDGRYISFTASRGAGGESGSGAQIWLLDRRGGEAQRLTNVRGGISSYEWSPDGKRLLLTVQDTAA